MPPPRASRTRARRRAEPVGRAAQVVVDHRAGGDGAAEGRRRQAVRPAAGHGRRDRAGRAGGCRASRSAVSSASSAAPNVGLPHHRDRRRQRRLGVAEHEPRLDRAVVAVDLEPHGRVDRLARRRGQRAAAAEGDAARARAARRERERDVAALPHRPRVVEQRARDEQRRLGVAHAERGEPLRAPRPAAAASASPGTTASTRWTGTRSSGASDAAACATNAARNASTARRARSCSPAAARWPPWRSRSALAASSPPSRSNAGIERPEPVPSSPSSAISTAGRWWRSAIREATMPITPGCQPSAASTYAAGSAAAAARGLRDLRLGLEQDPRLDVAALDVDRVELGGDRAGPLDVGRQQQLQPRVGAVQPPGGVDPRREPEADRARVDAARVDARHVHQRLQPGLARRGQRAQPRAHEPPVLAHERHAVGDRGERDEVEVRVGGRRIHARGLEQRPREQVRDAGRAQLRARVAADARVHDRRVGQRARRRAASGGR